jgi:hypothetical protein
MRRVNGSFVWTHNCPTTGAIAPLSCPAGFICPSPSAAIPVLCPAGRFCAVENLAVGTSCAPGVYCPAGSTAALLCPAGSKCNATDMSMCVHACMCACVHAFMRVCVCACTRTRVLRAGCRLLAKGLAEVDVSDCLGDGIAISCTFVQGRKHCVHFCARLSGLGQVFFVPPWPVWDLSPTDLVQYHGPRHFFQHVRTHCTMDMCSRQLR